jgi:hypothetical protein
VDFGAYRDRSRMRDSGTGHLVNPGRAGRAKKDNGDSGNFRHNNLSQTLID